MIPRHLTARILDALHDTPVVYLQGGRQVGKSTLAQAIADGAHEARYLSMDRAAVLAAAQADPEGFVGGLEGPVVLDEVQRVPGLPLAIKSAVDADRTPGRFLLTGSAHVLALPHLSQALAGRMELCTLWPFSQGEILGRRESFVGRVFAKRLSLPRADPLKERDLIQRILAGGYPEVIARRSADRRAAWLDSHITTVIDRDVRDLASIERLAEVPRLLKLVAARASQLVNYADLARSLSIPQSTLKRYMALLEATFLARLLPAWFANIGKRLIKSPKLLLTDTGLLGQLLGIDMERMMEDRTLRGHVVENFVAVELLKQLDASSRGWGLFHFRTETGREADLVLEDAAGRIVGIEVRSAMKVDRSDARGLEALAEAAGDRFVRGIVLYLGDTMVPFDRRLAAVPLPQLWA